MSPLLALNALALGWLALGLLRIKLRAAERWPAAFAIGTPLLAALVLLLVKLHLFRRTPLLAATAALVALALWRRRQILLEDAPPLPRPLLALCAAGLLALSAWAGYNAFGPDTTPAGSDQTFAAAAQIVRGAAKPHWDVTALWSAALRINGHAAVPRLHAIYLPALALAFLALLRRHLPPHAAVLAALLLAAAPAFQLFAARSGAQLVWLLCLFTALWLAHLAGQTRQPRLLLPVLLLAVFAAKLNPLGGSAPGGYLFGWFPWQATLPLAALLAWTLQRQPLCLAALAAFQFAASLPPITPPPQPTSQETARLLESDTPAHALTLAEHPVASAWTARRSTTEPALLLVLQSAWDENLRPTRQRRQFITSTPRRSFLIERSGHIAEVRFYRNDTELPRNPAWQVRSLQGEPAATLAFDNSPVTNCDCAIEINFAAPVEFDEVRINGTEGDYIGAPKGLRRAAALELKRRGITHILAWEKGPLYGELSRNAQYWGVKEVGFRDAAHLFTLE
ncbi:MAG: hypothetical protein IPP47_01080 [Bryobacterales bacterium]|nr:hypothetical protein [Bryobacterales bacterium]